MGLANDGSSCSYLSALAPNTSTVSHLLQNLQIQNIETTKMMLILTYRWVVDAVLLPAMPSTIKPLLCQVEHPLQPSHTSSALAAITRYRACHQLHFPLIHCLTMWAAYVLHAALSYSCRIAGPCTMLHLWGLFGS
jgi:hypothetical protein